MKTLFFSVCLLLPVFLFSQNSDSTTIIQRVDSLIQIARTATDQRQFESALKSIQAAEDLVSAQFGEDHIKWAVCYFNHGRALQNSGNLKAAESYYLKAKNRWERFHQTSVPEYGSCLFNLANLYNDLSRYEDAEMLYLQVVDMRKQAGKESAGLARVLNALANLYTNMAKYEEASARYVETLEMRERLHGTTSAEYGNTLNGYSNLFFETGDYAQSEHCLLEVRRIYAKVYGDQHPEYARCQLNLANLYTQIGLYETAEPLFQFAISVWGEKWGKDNVDYGLAVADLAHLYFKMQRYSDAEPLFRQAQELQKNVLGIENPAYLTTSANLAALYMEMGRLQEAEQLFKQNISIQTRIFGEMSWQAGLSMNSYGTLLIRTKRFAEAELILFKARRIFLASLGKEHPHYTLVIQNLTDLYYAEKRINEAAAMQLEASALRKTYLAQIAPYFTELQLFSHIQLYETDLSVCTYSPAAEPVVPSLVALYYDNLLFYKGFLLAATQRLRNLAKTNPASAPKLNSLASCHRRLAAEYAKPVSERKNVTELENKAGEIEKELAHDVAGFGSGVAQISWREVQSKLEPGAVAIEFIRYRLYHPGPSDSMMYAALILRAGDSAPQWISLFEEKQLSSLLRPGTSEKAAFINQLYRSGVLKQLIFEPMRPLLTNAKNIYYAPAGLLHRLSLEAIFEQSENPGDVVFHRLGSTRQLVTEKRDFSFPNQATAVVYGGIQYDMDSLALFSAVQALHETSGAAAPESFRGVDGKAWSYLPWTEIEAKSVSALLTKAGARVQMRQGYAACEESFSNLGQSDDGPDILHLATHAFFFPAPKIKPAVVIEASVKPGFQTATQPLMRSGLILAGANRAWTSGKPLDGFEDGILTSYEISQMNLGSTGLVVLSACETGLGDLDGSEGVYGLQRAFKMAGARYLIMSLWQVPDYQTEALMTAFYTEWLGGKKTVPEAFHTARQQMKAQFKEPFYWAGFVLVE